MTIEANTLATRGVDSKENKCLDWGILRQQNGPRPISGGKA
jgi:hypothetical protein